MVSDNQIEALAKKYLPFKLNDEQRIAVTNIKAWLDNPMSNDRFRVLGGYAGTGKSSILKLITKFIPNCCVCAPTNKAVKVVRDICPDVDSCTIYSLLGLKMEQNEDSLILTKALKEKIGRYELIIVDEAGMINTEVLGYIEGATKLYGVKILFVGDPAQLNPVGEQMSPIWGRYPIEVMKTVERHDNQILTFATKVRGTKLRDLVIESDHDADGGVWYVPETEFKNMVAADCDNGNFSKMDCIAVAWRNKTVKSLNSMIRKRIHGEKASTRWLVGDRVVFTGPFGEDIVTDDDGKIIGVSEGVMHRYGVETYSLRVELSTGERVTVPVLHENSEEKASDMRFDFSRKAKEKGIDYPTKKKRWEEFWSFVNSFAELSYGYAITAHRAQGSTYKTAYVDSTDILMNSNQPEARRCLYVASTRPTTRLILC